jgi:2,3-bisphosphoglycerate-independent phosphoglycerate mutase
MMSHIKTTGGKLHLMGCIGGGVVHSSINHLYAFIKFAQDNGLKGSELIIHAFTDGRDSPPKSAEIFLEQVEGECERRGVGKIGSVIGRSIAMDRDERWEKVEITYDMLTKAKGKQYKTFKEAITDNYSRDLNDEYIEPSIILGDNSEVISQVKPGDAVLCFNYRADRSLQLAQAFEEQNFTFFKRERLANVLFVGMTEYEKGLPRLTAYPPEKINLPLGRVLSEAGLRQLRISESEKFPHVTYFFDGGIEISFNGEDRVEIPSPREVATYDQKPEMSSLEVTEKLISQAKLGVYDFIMVNYANVDMVAHTGVLNAGIKAVQVVDQCIARLVDTILPLGGSVMITADHGNAEEMIDLKTGEVDTKHSTNPVPFLYISSEGRPKEIPFGRLADVAPTILNLLEVKKPGDMTGRDLLN